MTLCLKIHTLGLKIIRLTFLFSTLRQKNGTSKQMEVEFGGPCCFCGEMIEETQIEQCRIAVEIKNGLSQVLFSYAQCFK